MKKDYVKPVAELTPVKMEYTLCLTSLEKLLLESGELDPDSD